MTLHIRKGEMLLKRTKRHWRIKALAVFETGVSKICAIPNIVLGNTLKLQNTSATATEHRQMAYESQKWCEYYWLMELEVHLIQQWGGERRNTDLLFSVTRCMHSANRVAEGCCLRKPRSSHAPVHLNVDHKSKLFSLPYSRNKAAFSDFGKKHEQTVKYGESWNKNYQTSIKSISDYQVSFLCGAI
jgi:hypothetical protein